jgi:AraC-like DNA-binding protein
MNELESFQSQPQSLTISNHVDAATLEIDVNESSKSGCGTFEICRFYRSAEKVRTFAISKVRLDLLRFAKHASLEFEFLMPSHLVIFLLDDIPGGCDWSDGHQTRTLASLAPHAFVFNPAQKYLRIRTAVLSTHCHMLALTIQPSLMRWRGDLEIDLNVARFRQIVGFTDDTACQSLVAMKRELEEPGVNGAFLVDMLLFLLLTRLARRASTSVDSSSAAYTKGGLPTWRLKRAIELLEVDHGEMPTLSGVAKLIGLHPTSFCRGFKQSTGVSPHRYMLVHRVNRAKEMMSDQMVSLTEIALECGFGSSSQFSVVFKKITGMSPREYRRAI